MDQASLDQKMDSGEQPYVMLFGKRLAVAPSVMEELIFEVGQDITDNEAREIYAAHANLAESKCLT